MHSVKGSGDVYRTDTTPEELERIVLEVLDDNEQDGISAFAICSQIKVHYQQVGDLLEQLRSDGRARMVVRRGQAYWFPPLTAEQERTTPPGAVDRLARHEREIDAGRKTAPDPALDKAAPDHFPAEKVKPGGKLRCRFCDEPQRHIKQHERLCKENPDRYVPPGKKKVEPEPSELLTAVNNDQISNSTAEPEPKPGVELNLRVEGPVIMKGLNMEGREELFYVPGIVQVEKKPDAVVAEDVPEGIRDVELDLLTGDVHIKPVTPVTTYDPPCDGDACTIAVDPTAKYVRQEAEPGYPTSDPGPRFLRFPDREEYESYLKKGPLAWDELPLEPRTASGSKPPEDLALMARDFGKQLAAEGIAQGYSPRTRVIEEAGNERGIIILEVQLTKGVEDKVNPLFAQVFGR